MQNSHTTENIRTNKFSQIVHSLQGTKITTHMIMFIHSEQT